MKCIGSVSLRHIIWQMSVLMGLAFFSFVKVNRRGEPISIHNRASYVTIGICAANPSSPMPNAMLVAHEVPMSPHESMTSFWKISEQPSHMEHLALTRSVSTEKG